MKRCAGILLHISSLPGKGPIGDFGEEAYRFIDFLQAAKQRYWQILPLNQVNGGTAHSPYSPLSAFAGNILYISENILFRHGFIRESRNNRNNRSGNKVDFRKAEKYKKNLVEIAFEEFNKEKDAKVAEQFNAFCMQEENWLNDYAIFMALRKYYKYKSWNKWPVEIRDRTDEAIQKAKEEHATQIEKEKFGQFLFEQQWTRLKNYANERGVNIFGDVPIYIGYDSADVWSHPQNFLLTEDKEMMKVSGVPPDYFNKDGQLWNMPIFKWDHLKKTGYRWWINRISRNLKLYDFVRLDHFRGFSAYWEVDSGEKTAKKGKWTEGPSYAFFDTLKHKFPEMPFAAEDLGDIDEAVYKLRDTYNLPGMRVMQFAFGSDWPESIHLPHKFPTNCIAYTGTHDNNTVKGWFTRDITKKTRKHVRHYAARKLSRRRIHKEFIRMVYASFADTAIIPMQDVLGLGRKTRMNFPSSTSGNWKWRMKRKQLRNKHARVLSKLVDVFGRSISVD